MTHLTPFRFLLFGLFFLEFALSATGQESFIHNLNIDNGLPSNLIYKVIKDRNGYIWLGTDDGVVRYNGYETKIFNQSEGLPSNDIWGLEEDKKGRIWLRTISNEFGYMVNGRYRHPILPSVPCSFYPQQVFSWKNGILFLSPYTTTSLRTTIWCADNDSLIKFPLADTLSLDGKAVDLNNPLTPLNIWINPNGQSMAICNDALYFLDILPNHTFKLTFKYKLTEPFLDKWLHVSTNLIYGNYFFSVTMHNNYFSVLDIESGKMQTINLHTLGYDDPIEGVGSITENAKEKYISISTSKNILQFDITDSIRLAHIFTIEELVGSANNGKIRISQLLTDSLWKYCIATNNNGLYENYNIADRFKKEIDFDLHNFSYIGGEADQITFWWNDNSKTLIKIDSNLHIAKINTNISDHITRIIHINDDTFMVLLKRTVGGVTLYNAKKNCFFMEKNNWFRFNLYALWQKDSGAYFISQNGLFWKPNLYDRANTIKMIDGERYNGLEFDSLRHSYWAYNQETVLIRKQDTNIKYTRDQLQVLGIKKIEQILIDKKYGNIFIRGSNLLTLYNPDKKTYSYLFDKVNIKKTTMAIYRNTLVTAGRFGILFSKIIGPQKLSAPLIYPNIKDINYKYVFSMQASGNKILLNTDKGAFWVDMPADQQILSLENNFVAQYKFIVIYKDTTFSAHERDTLKMDQKFPRLQFDIINPAGNGTPKYKFQITPGDGVWHELNSNELTLSPNLVPGQYYTLSLKAADEVWVSDKLNITIYIQPLWWQVIMHNRFFWWVITLLIFLLLGAIVLITKRVVTRNDQKRNLRLSLELKSVYSQINPHFIFNTLGTVMFFIKKKQTDDAYSYLSKFSKLLRAYIKSSRNQYITIAEEVENLNNYIQLQQARFEDKFEYNIEVDNEISAESIKIPSLLLQPIVENAIDHGIFHKETKGHLKIEFKKISLTNEIICVIDDDGIGRLKSKMLAKSSIVKTESYGERLIADLVTVFNKYEKIDINIKYIDKIIPQTGTTVMISIKYPPYAK